MTLHTKISKSKYNNKNTQFFYKPNVTNFANKWVPWLAQLWAACCPGGHWDNYYTRTLYCWSHHYSLEDWKPINFIYQPPIIKLIA